MIVSIPIRSAEELIRLRKRAARCELRSIALKLDVDPDSGTDSLADAEARINRHLHPCGCELAAAFLALAMTAAVTLAVLRSRAGHHLTASQYAWTIAAVFAATFLGKLLGIAYGEFRLARAIDHALRLSRLGAIAPTLAAMGAVDALSAATAPDGDMLVTNGAFAPLEARKAEHA